MVYYLYITSAGEKVVFEFDEVKSRANKAKHGIDFVEAQELWADAMRVETPVRSDTEERFVVFGKISDKRWTAVITYRASRVRLISVRRSRKVEVAVYEG